MSTFFAHWCSRMATQPRLDRRTAIGKGVHRHDPGRVQPAAQRAGGIGHHRRAANLQDWQVRRSVADIAELRAEPLLERMQLIRPGQVVGRVRSQNAGKQRLVVRRHAFGQRAIGGCSKVNRAARRMLMEQIFKQRLVIGQVRHIQGHGGGYMLLEGGFTLRQPARNAQQGTRILACQRKHGVDKGIGPDESSVQVDAKRGLGIWSRHEGRTSWRTRSVQAYTV